MNQTAFTLHARLTKYCNASCNYCSSWAGSNRLDYMKPTDFRKSLEFILSVWSDKGIHPQFLSMQYVGGEILSIPWHEFNACVQIARRLFENYGITFVDGCQSNLMASTKRIDQLNMLFNGRIGTSIDHFTNNRKIGGSSAKYKRILIKNESDIVKTRPRFPAVYVVDGNTKDVLQRELQRANRENRMLTLRPIFQGGTQITKEQKLFLVNQFVHAFDQWFMTMGVIIEPFFTLVKRRISTSSIDIDQNVSPGCNFQKDCATQSLNLDPNGDLYLCVELADMGIGKIGNALTGELDDEVWSSLLTRTTSLHSDCLSCDYLKQCQGGCMAQAIDSGHGMYGKPELCKAWMHVFQSIDTYTSRYGFDEIKSWISKLENKSMEYSSC